MATNRTVFTRLCRGAVGAAAVALCVAAVAALPGCSKDSSDPVAPDPPAAPPAWVANGDAIDPSTIVWDSVVQGIGAWPITAKITVANLGPDTMQVLSTGTEKWPVRNLGKPDIGNFWIIGGPCADGRIHGGTVDWMGPGRTSTDSPKFQGRDQLGGDMINGWRPRKGDTAYVMLSTHARSGHTLSNNKQRSNIVKVTVP